ncbi:LANO_0F01970g1_1 [Lachancea nothofagi CBS 11611]|uniref:Ribosome biogenesis protein NSA1 n=1 Tax=Lachancea nothofagi CBS 11611 TaxID=1266666 RepID=A0A1G4K6M8_9SACH|nr:LANO_0F01970g1_1 [Lachancea nothofagi CBS 11611]
MRLLVACDDSGSIKEVVCNRKTDTSIQKALQPLHVGVHLSEGLHSRVQDMALISETLLVVSRANGLVQLIEINQVARDLGDKNVDLEPKFEISDLKVISSVQGLLDDAPLLSIHKNSKKRSKPRDGFVALRLVPGYTNRILCATKSGQIHILSLHDRSLQILKSHRVTAPLEFAQIYDNVVSKQKKKSTSVTLAYGGEENLVKIVRISGNFETMEKIWEAKNVSNDRLDLKVPVWPMKLRFLDPVPDADSSKVNFQFVTINHLGHLRNYQTTRGRKPISSQPLLAKNEIATQLQVINCDLTPLNNVKSARFDDLKFVIADSKKNVLSVDSSANVLGKFGNGDITGSPSFVNVVDQKYLLEGGLDSYARVFDVSSREPLCKCYMGAKLSSMLLLDDEEIDLPQSETTGKKRVFKQRDEKVEAIENEEIWQALESSAKKAKKD